MQFNNQITYCLHQLSLISLNVLILLNPNTYANVLAEWDTEHILPSNHAHFE